MCLLVIAWKVHPRLPLILAANRDEYHERPSEPLHQWAGNGNILAGRDLRAGGTWLAVDRRRRMGVITNYRDLQTPIPGAPSRGDLIPAYLNGSGNPAEFTAELASVASKYSGFNVLLTDRDTMCYAANRAEPFARALSPGIYGLSNGLLDAPSPKLRRVRRRFEELLGRANISHSSLFAILEDRERTTSEAQGTTGGMSPDLEEALSAPFVLNPLFGTRCSTVVLIENGGALKMVERRFDNKGVAQGDNMFTFHSEDW